MAIFLSVEEYKLGAKGSHLVQKNEWTEQGSFIKNSLYNSNPRELFISCPLYTKRDFWVWQWATAVKNL